MISQFIYGKFCSNNNSGYRLVACTSDLENEKQQLINLVEKTHYFWGSQGGKNGKAVGVFEWQEKGLVLAKVNPAIDKNQKALLSGVRTFYQYHYIIIPQDKLVHFTNNVVDILLKFLDKLTPYFYDFNSPVPYQDFAITSSTPWFDNVLDLFEEIPKTLIQNKGEINQKFWQEKYSENNSFLELALASVLTKQRLILTKDPGVSDPIDFLEYLMLLLPVNYRKKLAVAIGSVDERKCSWADIIVVIKELPKLPLPEELIWLNRSSKKIEGDFDLNILNNEYMQEFIIPIFNQPENLDEFISFLNTLTTIDFTIKDFNNPDKLIYIIPGLPEKQCIDLWCKYIPKISLDWESIIDDFVEKYPNFWNALVKLTQQNDVDITLIAKLILIVINKKYIDKNYEQLLESIQDNIELSYILVDHDLLDHFMDESKDTAKGHILIKICNQSIKYISHDSRKFLDFFKKCISNKNLFSSKLDEFNLLDVSFTEELDIEIFKTSFNQEIINILPCLKIENVNQSNLFEYLTNNYSNVLKSVNLLFEQRDNSLVNLTEIAREMKMTTAQKDIAYRSFLEHSLPSYQVARPLLIDVIHDGIKSTDFYQNPTSKTNNDVSQEQEFNLEQNQNIFPKTYQWFKKNRDFNGILISINQTSKSWENWQELSRNLYDKSIHQIGFLDKIVGNLFPKNLLSTWFDLLEKYPDYEQDFFKSYTWSKLQVTTAIELFQAQIKWAKTIVHYAIADNRLEIISGDFLHYLKNAYLEKRSISQEDKQLWNDITTPSTLSYLNNDDWLNLWSMKWKIAREYDLPSPIDPLTDTKQESFYRITKELLNTSSNLQECLSLLNYCDDYKLPSGIIKKLAIFLIRSDNCSNSQDVYDLIKSCRNLNLSNSQQIDILNNVDLNLFDQKLLDLLFLYFDIDNSFNSHQQNLMILQILFKLPNTTPEIEKKVRLFYTECLSHTNNLTIAKQIGLHLLKK